MDTMEVYVNGALQRYTDYHVNQNILVFPQAPPAGTQIHVKLNTGWVQGFVGNGFQTSFVTDEKIYADIEDTEVWECRIILQEVNEQLMDPRLQEEVRRLGTFLNMLKEYDSN